MLWIITKLGPEMQDMPDRIGVGRFLRNPGSEMGGRLGQTFHGHIKRFDPTKGGDPVVLPALIEGFTSQLEWEFQLRDSDGDVHFEGRCDNIEEALGESAFEPLDVFQDDTGCTALFYRKVGQEEWSEL